MLKLESYDSISVQSHGLRMRIQGREIFQSSFIFFCLSTSKYCEVSKNLKAKHFWNLVHAWQVGKRSTRTLRVDISGVWRTCPEAQWRLEAPQLVRKHSGACHGPALGSVRVHMCVCVPPIPPVLEDSNQWGPRCVHLQIRAVTAHIH
jgi:hypothetical protein